MRDSERRGGGGAVAGAGAGVWDWLQRDASCLTPTPYGPVYVRDGASAATPPRYPSQPPHKLLAGGGRRRPHREARRAQRRCRGVSAHALAPRRDVHAPGSAPTIAAASSTSRPASVGDTAGAGRAGPAARPLARIAAQDDGPSRVSPPAPLNRTHARAPCRASTRRPCVAPSTGAAPSLPSPLASVAHARAARPASATAAISRRGPGLATQLAARHGRSG